MHHLNGDYEKYFHTYFKASRKIGEWFEIPELSEKLISEILSRRKEAPPGEARDIGSITRISSFHILFFLISITTDGVVGTGPGVWELFVEHRASQGLPGVNISNWHKGLSDLVECGLLEKIGKAKFRLELGQLPEVIRPVYV